MAERRASAVRIGEMQKQISSARKSRASVSALGGIDFRVPQEEFSRDRSMRKKVTLGELDLKELRRKASRYELWKNNVIQNLSVFIEQPQVETFIIFLVFAYGALVFLQLTFQEEIHGSKSLRLAINIMDLCILGIFQIEIAIKIIVFGWVYIWDVYQLFDAVLVTVSIAMGILDLAVSAGGVLEQVLSLRGILRILRILIIFRRVSESQSSLSRIHRSNLGYDISSPVERVIMTMQKLALCRHISRQDRWELNESVKIIRQGKLYEPVLGSQETTDMDEDAQAWLLKATGDHSAKLQDAEEEKVVFTNREKVNVRTHNPETESILNGAKEWCIDIWKLQHATSDNALVVLLRRLCFKSGLFEQFVDIKCWDNFTTSLQAGYRKTNHYHNAVHAADVTHSSYWILNSTEFVARAKVSPLEQLSLLISSACHDVDHRGTNNNFMVQTKDAVAIRYNDKHVLENHHVAVAFRILQQPNHNIFNLLPASQYDEIRVNMTNNILATDIATHFEHLGKLKSRMTGDEFPETRDDKLLLLGIALHCGDISNPTKPRDTYLMWTERVLTEYFLQGDREKELGFYPISMFTDRLTTNIAKCQIGFIDVLVHPLFRAVATLLETVEKTVIPILIDNKSFWEPRIEEMQQHMGEEPLYMPKNEE